MGLSIRSMVNASSARGIAATTRLLLSLSTLAAVAFFSIPSQAVLPDPVGPVIWGGYTQNQLDAVYDQSFWDDDPPDTGTRGTYYSDELRKKYGAPTRVAYGPSQYERADIYLTDTSRGPAPIMIFIHGGAWRGGSASTAAVPAEMFMNAGAHFIALDFVNALQNGGSILEMAEQVRRAIAWVHNNAQYFGGDPHRIYISGHSSGGHLCGVAITTNWREYSWANRLGPTSVPFNVIKGALCFSGMYELYPVSLSARRLYVNFTPETLDQLSPQRHIELINAPLVIANATRDTPEFQRQSRDFAAAVRDAGKPVTYLIAQGYNHFEEPETLGNPYGVLGRAALQLMGLKANALGR